MFKPLASALAAFASIGLTACDSAKGPISPSDIPSSPHIAPHPATDSVLVAPLKAPDTGPIVVGHGELDIAGGDGTAVGELSLKGTRGFSLTSRVDIIGGRADAFLACSAGDCAPGTSIPLLAQWSGSDLRGTVTLDGVTYQLGESAGVLTNAVIRFDGTVVAPPLTKRGFDQLTAPFTVTGQFFHQTLSLVINETFTGSGEVRVWLEQRPPVNLWQVVRLVYRMKHESKSPAITTTLAQ